MKKNVIGVWCGNAEALKQQVHGVPILRLTLKRFTGTSYALIPWIPALDWLEQEVSSWKVCRVKRCHTDERIAMRDLIVETEATAGAIIQGDCALLDKAEIDLALARVDEGWVDGYASARVRCYSRKMWLGFSDDQEWAPYPLPAIQIQNTLHPSHLDERWARIKARESASR